MREADLKDKVKRSGLSVKIPYNLKEQFKEACEANGSYAAQEIRAFMFYYINRYDDIEEK